MVPKISNQSVEVAGAVYVLYTVGFRCQTNSVKALNATWCLQFIGNLCILWCALCVCVSSPSCVLWYCRVDGSTNEILLDSVHVHHR